MVEDVCRGKRVELDIADFSRLERVSASLDGQTFTYCGGTWQIPLLGAHQLCNAAVVLETIGALGRLGWQIDNDAAAQGLMQTSWPARFELMQRDPPFVVDGGHNPQGAETAAEAASAVCAAVCAVTCAASQVF